MSEDIKWKLPESLLLIPIYASRRRLNIYGAFFCQILLNAILALSATEDCLIPMGY